MALREYQRKRDFTRTAEPKAAVKRTKGASRFVIQKHNASRLHYDFRLEMGGVLKSWAVPKGIPLKKGEKHLAVHVEDHPLDYASFEGTIPKGQYGGGTVMVWDSGTFEGLGSDHPERDLEEGKLHFALHGEKLDGEWTLIHIRHGEEGNEWLLLKSGESARPILKKRDDESSASGRTMAQIAAASDAVWQSNRESEPGGLKARIRKKLELGRQEGRKENESGKLESGKKKGRTKSSQRKSPVASSPSQSDSILSSPFPAFLLSRFKNLPPAKAAFAEPMKAKLTDATPRSGDWIYELKFDGFRALAIKAGKGLELISRNQKPLTKKFPEILPALTGLPWKSGVIDGEIVAMDEEGRSSFQLLQAYEMNEERPPICFYAFDFLNLDDRDLRGLPLRERKAMLRELLGGVDDTVRFSDQIDGDPVKLLAEVKQRGLEGLIGKQPDSQYESGRRSGAWIKLKVTNEQEFVIAGYTTPQGSRKFFGALLVGFYERGALQFATKVGTGFTEKNLRELHRRFQPLRIETCPFANLPTKRQSRWGQGITRAEMGRCTWLEPRFVGQVRFTEWTRDGGLRHPAFLGLREDKAAKEVVREIPAATGSH